MLGIFMNDIRKSSSTTTSNLMPWRRIHGKLQSPFIYQNRSHILNRNLRTTTKSIIFTQNFQHSIAHEHFTSNRNNRSICLHISFDTPKKHVGYKIYKSPTFNYAL